jgi:hypothetical protein
MKINKEAVIGVTDKLRAAITLGYKWILLDTGKFTATSEDLDTSQLFFTKNEAIIASTERKPVNAWRVLLVDSVFQNIVGKVRKNDPGNVQAFPEGDIDVRISSIEFESAAQMARQENIEKLTEEIAPWGLTGADHKYSLQFHLRRDLPQFGFSAIIRIGDEPVSIEPQFSTISHDLSADPIPIYGLDHVNVAIIRIPDLTIADINTKELENRMKKIDWNIPWRSLTEADQELHEAIWKDFWQIWQVSFPNAALNRLYVKYWQDTYLDEASPRPGLLRFDYEEEFSLRKKDSAILLQSDPQNLYDNLRMLHREREKEIRKAANRQGSNNDQDVKGLKPR